MGLSVVTPTLGSVMKRVKLLAIAVSVRGLLRAFWSALSGHRLTPSSLPACLLFQHFVFGVVYSIGTVEISLETASLVLILSLIVGLSFTLTS